MKKGLKIALRVLCGLEMLSALVFEPTARGIRSTLVWAMILGAVDAIDALLIVRKARKEGDRIERAIRARRDACCQEV
mgnify:CR=1 FL=1